MEIKSALEILVEEGVIGEPDENINFNLILTRDCYVSRVKAINRAMKKYAAQFINLAAENTKLNMDNLVYMNNIELINGTKISINKESILKIKEQIK